MTAPAHESIVRFITVWRSSRDQHFPWQIAFFDDEIGEFAQLNGNLEVPEAGANIRFAKVHAPGGNNFSWDFHGLSIHPLGEDTRPVDLQWVVTNDEVRLHDNGIGPKRSFSYTISVRITESGHQDTAKVYFDPQLVNLGGSG